MRLQWGANGAKRWETGVDHGVLFLRDIAGDYNEGVPWNGLTNVTESPSGAESNKQYADNGVYANLKSAEEFGATIEAFTYPDEFGRCDGSAEPTPGVLLSQQGRETFGFSYRTRIGNDLTDDLGYKLHLVYGADAAPSEVSRATVNDSPELAAFSWEVTTTAVDVEGDNPVTGKAFKPTAHLTIDSTKVDPAALSDLEDVIYGDADNDPRLPLPNEVIDLFSGAVTVVDLTVVANQPTFVEGTGVITLPAVAGVQWKVNGVNRAAGAQPAIPAGTTAQVTAAPLADHTLNGDNDWAFRRPA